MISEAVLIVFLSGALHGAVCYSLYRRLKTDLSVLSREIRHHNAAAIELQVTDIKSQSDLRLGELFCSDASVDCDMELLQNDAIASAVASCVNEVIGDDKTAENDLVADGERVDKEAKEQTEGSATLEPLPRPEEEQSFAILGSWLWTRDKQISAQENMSNKDADTTSN